MKILVLGGGIAGLASAYAQFCRGDEVEVIEAREAVGLETSFGNGGLMSPSLCEPWNQPGVSKIMIPALLGGKNSMLRIHPKALPSLALWGLRFLRNSTAERFLEASRSDYHLSNYSLQRTMEVVEENDFDIKFQNNGIMAVMRDKATLEHAAAVHAGFGEFGLEYKVLDKAAAIAQEPHLAHSADDLEGGIFFPDGQRGECPVFCSQLSRLMTDKGVTLRSGVSVKNILVDKGKAIGVATNQGNILADHVIVALGNHAAPVLRTAGVKLGIRPAKGYTITVPVDAELPKTIMLDIGLHIGIIPMLHDNCLRIGGGAEFAGMDATFYDRYAQRSYANLERTLPHLVPHLRREEQQTWAGMRPVTFDGKPFIGGTSVDKLYVNAGLGHLGWTQGMGAGEMLADIIAGTRPEIDPIPFLPER
jgi:D-amino-acid dehydrogenase